jgi:hypothetical protein
VKGEYYFAGKGFVTLFTLMEKLRILLVVGNAFVTLSIFVLKEHIKFDEERSVLNLITIY